MTVDAIGELLAKTITTIFLMAAPVLFVSLAIGFLVSLFQAATQINEVTLVFIPKMFAAGLVLWFAGGWMFQQLSNFMQDVATALPTIGQGGP